MLFYRKDKDSPTETVKKFDTILKDKQLNSDEKKIILKNKINFLIRGNKLNEANEELKNLLNNENDSDLILLKCYLVYKTEKEKEKIIEILSNDEKLKNIPEVKLFILQLMLQTLNVKNPEKIHKSILNFINDYKEFSYNEKFLSFFIGFYLSRKLYSQLKEFINNFNDLKELQNKINNNQSFKKIIIKIGNFYYITNDYENSIKYYKYYLDNIDNKDKEITILLIQSLSHNNIEEAEKLRRNIDETVIDLSNESINNLLSELFTKFKRQDKINKKKKKHKKKKRYPKNFNPKNPGPMPDPERWLPKMQKKKFRAKNKLAHQGAIADNETTTTQKFK
jgi:signal recognition particle subunit SRP72